MINCGLEIEFSSNNFAELFKALLNNPSIPVSIVGELTKTFSNISIKPEATVNGFEIVFPPTTTEEELESICGLIQPYAIFIENCAMHVHIPISEEKQLPQIYDYYARHESGIIQEAQEQDLYVDLNVSNLSDTPTRKKNLNVYYAYRKHKTVEHRIYKATFDYTQIMWAINQTKQIIADALAEEEVL